MMTVFINNAKRDYGIERTTLLLQQNSPKKDALLIDIDSRAKQLKFLTQQMERYQLDSIQTLSIDNARVMQLALENVANRIRRDPIVSEASARDYRRTISTNDDDQELGIKFIEICENLSEDILIAYQNKVLSHTSVLSQNWSNELTENRYSKIRFQDLMEALKEDIIRLKTHANLVPIKIGLIGYESAGKSSLCNRLRIIENKTDSSAAPIGMNKTSLFPIEYDISELGTDRSLPAQPVYVKLVDFHGLPQGDIDNNHESLAGNYVDKIKKYRCDIYLICSDVQFTEQMKKWYQVITEQLERKCLWIRTKIDRDFLKKFREMNGTPYMRVTPEMRHQSKLEVISTLRSDNKVVDDNAYLIHADYEPESSDAEQLAKDESFDLSSLIEYLTSIASSLINQKIQQLTTQRSHQMINTYFRRGYALNVMKYKVGAGFAAIIPFGDELPKYLGRKAIRDAFGLNKALLDYIKGFNLRITNYQLKIKIFKDAISIVDAGENVGIDIRSGLNAVGKAGIVVGAAVGDDAITIAAATGVATGGVLVRAIASAALLVAGGVVTAGVCAWSAISTGNHIFSYMSDTCDDMLVVTLVFNNSVLRSSMDNGNQSTTT